MRVQTLSVVLAAVVAVYAAPSISEEYDIFRVRDMHEIIARMVPRQDGSCTFAPDGDGIAPPPIPNGQKGCVPTPSCSPGIITCNNGAPTVSQNCSGLNSCFGDVGKATCKFGLC